MYSCSYCSPAEKPQKGCKRPKRRAIHPFGCTCDSDNRCDICKGKGRFLLKRCPEAYTRDAGIRPIMPYFFAWRNNSVFPDAGARIDQPTLLLEAFGILQGACCKREREIAEERNRK